MSTFKKPPIFCDNCPTLALATLDDAPLCRSCLVKALGEAPDRSLLSTIRPLRFSAIPMVGPHSHPQLKPKKHR